MATRERAADRGARLARQDLEAVVAEIHRARLGLDLTLEEVGRAVGLSYSEVGRIERGVLRHTSVQHVVRIGAVVGLDVRLKAYPGPARLRDAAQLALLDRFRARLPPGLTIRTEVPLRAAGDQRGWDMTIDGLEPPGRLRVEGVTRLLDAQAQIRPLFQKLRDDGGDHLLLLLADTRRNRAAARLAASALAELFPVAPRAAWAALEVGRYPGGSACLFV